MLSQLWKCRKTSKNKGKKTFLKKIQKSVDNYHNLSYTVQAVASETKTNKRHTGYGVLAQLGEHLPYKQRVTGSSPVGPIVTNVLCRCGSIGRAADL